MSEYLATIFPGLRTSPFRITSPADCKYNCIAWAANDAANWWWPLGDAPSIIWPSTVVRELTLEAFTAAYHSLGYVSGADESQEPGLEKVALFADPRRRPDTRRPAVAIWSMDQQLGHAEDVEHELQALEGEIYGAVAAILKRPVDDLN